MAKKISELNEYDGTPTTTSDDVIPVVQNNTTKKIKLGTILTAASSGGGGGGGAIITDVVEINESFNAGSIYKTYTYKGVTYNDVAALYNSNTNLLRSIFFVKFIDVISPLVVNLCLGTLYKKERDNDPDTYEIKLLM